MPRHRPTRLDVSLAQSRGEPRRRPAPRFFSTYFRPQEPVPRRIYLGTVAGSAVGLVALWCVFSYGRLVEPLFLPSPTAIISAGIDLARDGTLLDDMRASVSVIVTGWALAVVAGLPIGILMGSFKVIEALVEPVVDFVRYLPVSAMIPLLILYIGIGTAEKVAVIFIGTFFQLVLLVADVAAHVPHEQLDVSYTLGASRAQVVARVLLPATLPGVMDTLRITMGWAWTYLIVAEIVSADKGLGYLILNSMRGLFTDRIFVGLAVIGGLGLLFDLTFKWMHRRLLPWSPKA
ncbi:MAG TPA: ABC transporter permease [bacterium]|nr:ABC transporter permease [bacterium]